MPHRSMRVVDHPEFRVALDARHLERIAEPF